MDKKVDVQVMVESAIMIALAVVLSFFKILQMPQGGSVSLAMIPILLLAFRRGPLCGISSGIIFGVISLTIDGVIYHPLSVLFDYTLAFGVLGVAGFFKKNYPGIIAGTVVGVALRFVCSLISGAVLFAEYAPEGQNPWVYSVIYNGTYMLPELIICVVVLVVLFSAAKKLFFIKTR